MQCVTSSDRSESTFNLDITAIASGRAGFLRTFFTDSSIIPTGSPIARLFPNENLAFPGEVWPGGHGGSRFARFLDSNDCIAVVNQTPKKLTLSSWITIAVRQASRYNPPLIATDPACWVRRERADEGILLPGPRWFRLKRFCGSIGIAWWERLENLPGPTGKVSQRSSVDSFR